MAVSRGFRPRFSGRDRSYPLHYGGSYPDGRSRTDGTMPDRRTLEQRLRDSQEYNRRLVEAAAAPMLVVDARLGITDVNERAVALTGVPRHALIGSPIESCFVLPSPSREAVRRAVQTGRPSRFEAVVKPALGAERLVSVSATGFVDPLGDRRGLLQFGTDGFASRSDPPATGRGAPAAAPRRGASSGTWL